VRKLLRTIVGLMLLAVAVPVAAQTVRVDVDSEGRLLNVPIVSASPIESVHIRLVEATSGESFEVRYRTLETPDNTATPWLSDSPAASTDGRNFTITLGQTAPPFLLYSIARRPEVLTPEDQQRLDRERERLRNDLAMAEAALVVAPAQVAVDKAEDAVEAAEAKAEVIKTAAAQEIKRAETEIAALWDDIRVFNQREVDAAVVEIIRLEGEIRKLRAETAAQQRTVQAGEAAITAAQGDLEKAQAALEASKEANRVSDLRRQLNDNINRVQAANVLTLRRVGLLVLQRNASVVYYRTTVGSRERAIALERISPVPVTTTQQELFAVIVNRQLANFPEPFALTYNTTVREPENPTPVRPVFPAKAEAGLAERFTGSETAYTDFVMPFGRRFPANTVLTVSIGTYMRVISKDEVSTVTNSTPGQNEAPSRTTTTETRTGQRVALLSNEEYPQVRGLYWFNFTAGVNGSWLRNPSFARIKTTLDDPVTQEDETRYATEKVEGDVKAIPVFGLTVYTRPVDIQAPVGWYERLVPAPTIGFAFENPHENVFIGAAHEASRNLQIWWGFHFGKINRLQKTNAVEDPKNNAAPVVEKRFSAAPYAGISFNLNVIRTIFAGR
jgi:hypothetical protein